MKKTKVLVSPRQIGENRKVNPSAAGLTVQGMEKHIREIGKTKGAKK